ncbi:precorrin-2 C(20)-methyltransferase [uncultured Ferrovibrio sp.]|jgi:precorrin-2/cobalt-factor-2 C20-methyltransferase|uniref:precorrin-2 C(20)-methyltransferase n=1 Tax=uncultured Ferrovibrio sp. TaxID=1576913 RepID=UPI00262E41F5|nr:precorrin-2 C(20)-methyltransferase [uncultured Ferrovibrio sp.]
MTGRLYGLGIGPGDPELITVKALRLLRAAQVVAYPAPEEGDSLARSIVAPHLPGGQIELAIRMPLTVERFPAQAVYDKAAEELGAHLNAGRDVAVLCEGDPFFYGSFMYLFGRLAERFLVKVVPGVSSLTACAAASGHPLAARNDVLSIIPAPLPDDEIAAKLQQTDAAAIMKLGRHGPRIVALLQRLGLASRAQYIERATMAAQRVLPLAEIDPASIPYFAMILIHKKGEAHFMEKGI